MSIFPAASPPPTPPTTTAVMPPSPSPADAWPDHRLSLAELGLEPGLVPPGDAPLPFPTIFDICTAAVKHIPCLTGAMRDLMAPRPTVVFCFDSNMVQGRVEYIFDYLPGGEDGGARYKADGAHAFYTMPTLFGEVKHQSEMLYKDKEGNLRHEDGSLCVAAKDRTFGPGEGPTVDPTDRMPWPCTLL